MKLRQELFDQLIISECGDVSITLMSTLRLFLLVSIIISLCILGGLEFLLVILQQLSNLESTLPNLVIHSDRVKCSLIKR
jgi:hypothetical protein